MSDQVVFTEEEVEKIKGGLLALKSELFLKVSNQHGPEFAYNYPEIEYAREVMQILDSPRPRPKLPQRLYLDLAAYALVDTNKIIDAYGFDVED